MKLKNVLKSKSEDKEVRKMFRKKGQSTLEYVIVLTAIVAAVILGARYLGGRVQTSMTTMGDRMNEEVTSIHFGGAAEQPNP